MLPESFILIPNRETNRLYSCFMGLERKPVVGPTNSMPWPTPVTARSRRTCPDLAGLRGDRWSIRYSSEAIVSLADQLNIDRFHLAGISMGGTVALQVAIDFPDRLISLVLINTFATLRPKHWSEWTYLVRRYVRARVRGASAQADLTASRIFPGTDQQELREELVKHIRQTDPGVYKQAMRELAVYDARHKLRNIHIPSLVISARNDTTVPLENQHDLYKGIPGSRQVFIENAGHGVIIDQPDQVNQTMIKFMNLFSI
jgi:3-oxoadipate enol-lactonase